MFSGAMFAESAYLEVILLAISSDEARNIWRKFLWYLGSTDSMSAYVRIFH